MEHSFDTLVAEIMGIEEAIIFKNIMFWVDKNRANKVNFVDGFYWSRCSVKAMAEIFPYMSEKTIRRALKHLEDEGYIFADHIDLGLSAYDRTLAYTITPLAYVSFGIFPFEKIESFIQENGRACSGKSLSRYKTRLQNNISLDYLRAMLDYESTYRKNIDAAKRLMAYIYGNS